MLEREWAGARPPRSDSGVCGVCSRLHVICKWHPKEIRITKGNHLEEKHLETNENREPISAVPHQNNSKMSYSGRRERIPEGSLEL